MSDDHHTSPQEPEDPVDVALADLLAGPSPVDMVHGSILLGDGVVPRPSDASIAAARNDVLAALWGAACSQERSMTTIVDFTTAVAA